MILLQLHGRSHRMDGWIVTSLLTAACSHLVRGLLPPGVPSRGFSGEKANNTHKYAPTDSYSHPHRLSIWHQSSKAPLYIPFLMHRHRYTIVLSAMSINKEKFTYLNTYRHLLHMVKQWRRPVSTSIPSPEVKELAFVLLCKVCH